MMDAPVFHIEPQAGLGSRMIQYMVALKFQSLVPGCRIANVMLPEWGIEHPPIDSSGPVENVAQQHHIDLDSLAERAHAGELRRVVYSGHGQRMENFLDADAYRDVFRSPVGPPLVLDERHLVCPIGTADARDDSGPFYPLTPVEFYADIVAETGLIPVFAGPAEPIPYTARLRERFPQAPFLFTGNAMLLFATIRAAKNIVVGVSTLAWLAAWLSQADRIFMAVSGTFNPLQYHFVDLLPFGDRRYYFTLFPINYAVPIEHHAAAHRRMAPFWRPVSHDVLQRRIKEPPRFEPTNDEILANFDAAFYLAANPDVAQLIGAGNTEGARAHYLLLGINEQRLPFRLAPVWYAARYPMAAFEVAQGDYSNFAHHYIAVGRARGYHPLPDRADSSTWWD